MELTKENSIANERELAAGKIQLDSTPHYVTIGAHYRCNAKCVFCLGGNCPEFSLEVYKERFEPKLLDVMKASESVGFCGFGEALLMPDILDFLDHLHKTLPGINKAFTTNGIALNEKLCEKFVQDRYSVQVSLHASYKSLHEKLIGINAFDKITDQIRKLAVMRNGDKTRPHINLVFLITSMNIENLPSFVAYAKGLGADMISCSYLTIFEPEQIKMSTFFMQEKTAELMRRAEAEAEHHGITLNLPPKYGKQDAKKGAGVTCRDPWEFFYVEMEGNVNPCCYAGDHIGHLDNESFGQIWNGAGYRELRESIVSGRIHNWCKHCLKYDPNNVNDLRSHVTFRPSARQRIKKYIQEHKNEFPEIAQEIEL